MNTEGLILTERGKDLMARAQAGTVITFSHIEYGSGIWSDHINPEQITGLVNPLLTLPIQEIKTPGDGSVVLTAAFTNSGIVTGFYHTETAIYADDPVRGKILYAVHYASDGSYIAAGGSSYLIEDVTNYIVVIGNAVNVQAVINNMVVLATKVDITDHNEDPEAHEELFKRQATGIPAILNPANGASSIGETPIFIFGAFVPTLAGTSEQAIQVQVDLIEGDFSNPLHDSGYLTTIAGGYEMPRGILNPTESYKVRTRRRLNSGLISPWSEVVFFTTRNIFNYVERPANLEPVNNAAGVQECPLLKSGPFSVAGAEPDTLAGIQFRVRLGNDVLHLSPELGAVLEYLIPAGLLLVSTDYVFECRHKGTLLSWSEWSAATGFRTVAAFITGDDAIYFSSWNIFNGASSAGVALADNAELGSNGVDQGEGETDLVSCSTRLKVRNPKRFAIDSANTTDKELVLYEEPTINDKILVDSGNILVESVSEKDSYPVIDFSGNSYNSVGASSTHFVQAGITGIELVDRVTGAITTVNTTQMTMVSMSDDGQVIAANKYGGAALLSIDGGATWTSPPGGGWVCSVSPSGDKIVFAGYRVSEVAISTNRGGTFNTLAVAGADTRKVYISDSIVTVVDSYSQGFRRSFDFGLTWELINYTCKDSEDWTYGCRGLGTDKDGIDIIILGDALDADGNYDLTRLGWCYANDPADNLHVVSGFIDPVVDSPARSSAVRNGVYYAVSGGKIVSLRVPQNKGEIWRQYASYAIPIDLENAPTIAHLNNYQLTVATGPAGTVFIPGDFSEVPIETATLGTDTDPDRPDFILLESVKQTPAESFRRVALGVRGLPQDALCNVNETQMNTWKEGA